MKDNPNDILNSLRGPMEKNALKEFNRRFDEIAEINISVESTKVNSKKEYRNEGKMKCQMQEPLQPEEASVKLLGEFVKKKSDEELLASETAEQIKRVVADYFEISVNDLIGKARVSSIVTPRQIAIFLCRCLTSLSTPEIGDKFLRNSATVLHAVQRIDNLLQSDKKMEQTVDQLKSLIQENSKKHKKGVGNG